MFNKLIHNENAVRQWIIVALGVIGGIAYFRMDRSREAIDLELKNARLISEQAEANVKAATLQFDARLKQLDTREKAAKAQSAELEAAKNAKPLLTVKPIVDQSVSVNDIREITLQTIFLNVGIANAEISAINVDVFEATLTPAVADIIYRTQDIFDLRGLLHGPPIADDSERARLSDEMEKLHKQCPHGKLFSIGKASADVTWRHLDHLSSREAAKMTLQPNASAFRKFVYLLTEYPFQHHRQWFRFVITVNPGLRDVAQEFEFIVSGLPLSTTAIASEVVYHSTAKPTSYHWAPDSPLIEVPPSGAAGGETKQP